MPNLIKLDRVISKTTMSKSDLYKKIRAGSFPAPVKTGVHSSAWDEALVDDWIDQRIAESSATSISGIERMKLVAAASARARKAKQQQILNSPGAYDHRISGKEACHGDAR